MIREHVAVHRTKAKEHKINPLWEVCMLQTYFVGKGRIDYFVVVDNIIEKKLITLDSAALLKEEEKDLFIKLENDYQDVKGDIEKQATIVQDFGDSRSAQVPWLERTGFPGHLVGLKDEEIKSSSQLPRKSEGDEKADVNLVRIIHAAESVLRDAYALRVSVLQESVNASEIFLDV
ncbi:hypothetical protein V501_09223 [Pseudogymnoascus sp. VKM F-4519 (FW-2642)]|nr:hypothetical protein V501_09223 [Pseudogymnoascus sp. VKM F-4519 (FW-2642)]